MVDITVTSNSRAIREKICYTCKLCNNKYSVCVPFKDYDSLPGIVEKHFIDNHSKEEILNFLIKAMFDRFEIKTTLFHNKEIEYAQL